MPLIVIARQPKFQRLWALVLKPKIENGDLMGPNGDPIGTQKLKKVPMGTHVGAVHFRNCVNISIRRSMDGPSADPSYKSHASSHQVAVHSQQTSPWRLYVLHSFTKSAASAASHACLNIELEKLFWMVSRPGLQPCTSRALTWIQCKLGKQYLVKKFTLPWESNPGPTPIRGELATLIEPFEWSHLEAHRSRKCQQAKEVSSQLLQD